MSTYLWKYIRKMYLNKCQTIIVELWVCRQFWQDESPLSWPRCGCWQVCWRLISSVGGHHLQGQTWRNCRTQRCRSPQTESSASPLTDGWRHDWWRHTATRGCTRSRGAEIGVSARRSSGIYSRDFWVTSRLRGVDCRAPCRTEGSVDEDITTIIEDHFKRQCNVWQWT